MRGFLNRKSALAFCDQSERVAARKAEIDVYRLSLNIYRLRLAARIMQQ